MKMTTLIAGFCSLCAVGVAGYAVTVTPGNDVNTAAVAMCDRIVEDQLALFDAKNEALSVANAAFRRHVDSLAVIDNSLSILLENAGVADGPTTARAISMTNEAADNAEATAAEALAAAAELQIVAQRQLPWHDRLTADHLCPLVR